MGSSPVRVTSKSLNRTLFDLGILLFGAPYGNGEEHVDSPEAIAALCQMLRHEKNISTFIIEPNQ